MKNTQEPAAYPLYGNWNVFFALLNGILVFGYAIYLFCSTPLFGQASLYAGSLFDSPFGFRIPGIILYGALYVISAFAFLRRSRLFPKIYSKSCSIAFFLDIILLSAYHLLGCFELNARGSLGPIAAALLINAARGAWLLYLRHSGRTRAVFVR